MCFSAGASFGVGATLAVAGVTAIGMAKTIPQKVFGVIPLIFSVQQLCEGVLWLALGKPQEYGQWLNAATLSFLIFAQIVWPFWVPFSIWILETNRMRKKILFYTLMFGTVISIYMAYSLINYPPIASINHYHIHYETYSPFAISWLINIMYGTATIASPFISSRKRMRVLGFGILFSYLFTQIFLAEFVVSVWCFLAAVLSVVVIYVNQGQNVKTVNQKIVELG
jgi:hypothetical protein